MKIPFSIQNLAGEAGSAITEAIRDSVDEINLDAKRILGSTENGKAPMLALSFSVKVDLRTGGVSYKLSGGSKFKVEASSQLKLDLATA